MEEDCKIKDNCLTKSSATVFTPNGKTGSFSVALISADEQRLYVLKIIT